jgi:hypothetical protein
MNLDPIVQKVLKDLKFNEKDCLWDCHGTAVMYHKYIETAGAINNITYDLYEVEFNTANKIAVIKCIAKHKDKTVTTYGEASPSNCKNAYTVAMAEKRAVDRAILKLLGIHGFVYSEDEVDNSDVESLDKIKETAWKLRKLETNKERNDLWSKLSPALKKELKKLKEINDLFSS